MSKYDNIFERKVTGGESNDDDDDAPKEYAGDKLREMLPISPTVFFLIVIVVAILIMIITGFTPVWFFSKKEKYALANSINPTALLNPNPYQSMNAGANYERGTIYQPRSAYPLKYVFRDQTYFENEGIISDEIVNKTFRQLQMPITATYMSSDLLFKDPIEKLNKLVPPSPEISVARFEEIVNNRKAEYENQFTENQKELLNRVDKLVSDNQRLEANPIKSQTDFASAPKPSVVMQRLGASRSKMPNVITNNLFTQGNNNH